VQTIIGSILLEGKLMQMKRAVNNDFFKSVRSNLPSWLIFSLSICVTFITWSIATKSAQLHTQDLFKFEVTQTISSIEQRMKGYEQMLRGGLGLFKSSKQVSRLEFHHYVSNLQVNKYWPGVQGIGYAVMLNPEEKDVFVNTVRLEGYDQFNIFPPGLRNKYSSILYLEPFTARNQRAFGYDMYSENSRHLAMDIARDNGEIAFSAKIKLVQEDGTDLQNGFLMYLPLYRDGATVENIEQRQKALVGYIYSPFRIDDLINGILLNNNNPGINFSIYDGDSEDADALFYAPKIIDGYLPSSDIKGFKPSFSLVETIEFPGRIWTIQFYSTSIFESDVDNHLANLVGFSGMVLSVLLLIVMLNITSSSRKDSQSKAKLEVLVDRLKAGASAGIVGIWDWDVENDILNWDSVMYQLYGLDESEFDDLYEAWISRVHIDDRMHIDGEIQAALRNEKEYCPEFRVLWPDNSVHYIKAVSKTSFDIKGKAIRIVGVNYDITEQKNIQIRLDKEASYDQLTQLPNRRLLDDILKKATASAQRNKKHMAVLFIDLDGFKQVNDVHGHHVGDWLLKEVSKRIQYCLRSSDTVGRIGGDEFLVVLPDISDNATDVANKIRKILEEPFVMTNSKIVNISSSIGVAVYPQHAKTQSMLIECADQAMYEAKKRGRNEVILFGDF
jgi:diguanylate cyclase (GGDEF)-like protein